MITHFAELILPTLSIEGVKQIYVERFQFPVVMEGTNRITLQPSNLSRLTFIEKEEPHKPAHFAFQVPFHKFEEIAEYIQKSMVTVYNSGNGHPIVAEENHLRMYFQDQDGNILEIYGDSRIRDAVLEAYGPLQVLYLREVGLPVPHVPTFRDWLISILDLYTLSRPESLNNEEIFRFVISQTAHLVVVEIKRPWIPISMKALPPDAVVVFGTPELSFLEKVADRLTEEELISRTTDQLHFIKEGYRFVLQYVPEVPTDRIQQLGLPQKQW